LVEGPGNGEKKGVEDDGKSGSLPVEKKLKFDLP
jgi:hypothetical protein